MEIVIFLLCFRIILLEALAQLCTTRKGREILRTQNTYIILREYHKWEQDKNALLTCENVVDILIRYEFFAPILRSYIFSNFLFKL